MTAADMDKEYRLIPGAVLLYYQDCWARFMVAHHLAAFDVIQQQKIWIISEFNAQFSSATTFWSEEVDVTVWNSELSPLRIYSDFRMTKAGTDILIACGYACWSLLNADTKHIERTDTVEGHPETIRELTLATHRRPRFNENGQLLLSVEHQVNRLDLDFNGHVNNRSYLNIAMLTATDDFMQSFSPASFQVQWLRETFLGDTIRCELYRLEDEPNAYLHLLFNGKNECVAKIHSLWAARTGNEKVIDSVSRR